MALFVTMIRTLFFYFFIVLCYRLMGKREVAQLGIIDLIVSILIAELVAISIEKTDSSIFLTVIPILVLVGLEILLAYISTKSKSFRNFFGGKPSFIILDGKINFKEMVSQRYTLDDLLLELRQNNIKSIDEVEYAILELNGKLSIFKYNFLNIKSNYPMPLILDGKLQEKTLNYLKKDKSWLETKLLKKNLDMKNIFYAFYKNNKLYLITYNNFIQN